jgi:hypothetical protein
MAGEWKLGVAVVVTSGTGPRIAVADNGAGFPKVDGLLLLRPFWKGMRTRLGRVWDWRW